MVSSKVCIGCLALSGSREKSNPGPCPVGLIREGRRGGERLRGLKAVGLVVYGVLLLGPVLRDRARRLGFLDRLGPRAGR